VTEEEFGKHYRAAGARRLRASEMLDVWNLGEHLCLAQFAEQRAGGGDSHFAAAGFERAGDVEAGARDDGAAKDAISR